MGQLSREQSFLLYDLTPQEIEAGSVLSHPMRLLIQNDLAQYAHEKLALEFDTQNPTKFIQEEAFRRGIMTYIKYLMDRSDTAEQIQRSTNPN